MDYHLPPRPAAERIRTFWVSRRLAANRYGRTTRNHHRLRELQHVAFVALLALGVVGGVLLMGV